MEGAWSGERKEQERRRERQLVRIVHPENNEKLAPLFSDGLPARQNDSEAFANNSTSMMMLFF